MVNLFTPATRVTASSGLAREARNLVDGSPETTWTSAGDPASELDPSSVVHTLWFTLRPPGLEVDSDDDDEEEESDAEPVQLARLRSLSLTFQGGYSAISTTLSAQVAGEWVDLAQVWPDDSNATQTFALKVGCPGSAATLRLTMHGSTDSFGRITLYGAGLDAGP